MKTKKFLGFNKAGDVFFILKKVDYIFYLVGFVFTYLVLNEIWGL